MIEKDTRFSSTLSTTSKNRKTHGNTQRESLYSILYKCGLFECAGICASEIFIHLKLELN